MELDIVVAATPEERLAAYRLRYDVYVREMARRQPEADHRGQLIADALDERGIVLLARDRRTGEPVGTLRTNLLRSGPVGHYEGLYGLGELSAAERHVTAITTRFIVARHCRRSRAAVQLGMAAFRIGRAAGIQVDYMDCNDWLLPFFERLGYRRLKVIEHPLYGQVNLMRLKVREARVLNTLNERHSRGLHDLAV
jgi:hypothetical protein